MILQKSWEMKSGKGPIIATAIHNGHMLRDELRTQMILDEATRLREEDPFTDKLTETVSNQISVYQSRFEYDLNRSPESAIYVKPEDAWGLNLWKTDLPQGFIDRSLKEHHRFYEELNQYLRSIQEKYPHFIVLDIHSYNHRRGGVEVEPDDPEENPEVNVGTGSLDRRRWGHVVDRFIKDMSMCSVSGRQLDVRENIKFKGRHLAQWIHSNYSDSACVLALEFKKIFMDEWTGKLYEDILNELKKALQYSIQGLKEELQKHS